MSSVGSIASSGLRAVQLRQDTAAHNIANLNTEGFRRQTVQQQEEAQQSGVSSTVGRASQAGSSPETDAVNQIDTTYSFSANLQVLRTQERMQGSLLDERA